MRRIPLARDGTWYGSACPGLAPGSTDGQSGGSPRNRWASRATPWAVGANDGTYFVRYFKRNAGDDLNFFFLITYGACGERAGRRCGSTCGRDGASIAELAGWSAVGQHERL